MSSSRELQKPIGKSHLVGKHGKRSFASAGVGLALKKPRITIGVDLTDNAKLLKAVRNGLKFTALEKLEKQLNAKRNEMSQYLNIPISTLVRRKKAGVLDLHESDRLVRIAKITQSAIDMMDGDDQAANTWLKTPQEILDNETPLERANTSLGSDDVENLIGRICHGVFS